jgi:23S rRNA-/tRNA-specific pseudouridylate synthase
VSNQDSTPKDDPARPTARFVTVSEDHDGQRVDNFLRTELKGAPKTLVYRILRTGEVRINKGRAKPDTRVHTGDVVRIPPLRLAEAMPVRVGEGLRELLDDVVIHEDEHLLILNKPAGLAVHAGSGIQVGLIEALRELRPELSGLELAHRLDRETSGVIALAKDRKTLLALHEFFAGDEVHKKYLAFVQGDVRAAASAWWKCAARVSLPRRAFAYAHATRRARSSKPSLSRDAPIKFACTVPMSAIHWLSTTNTVTRISTAACARSVCPGSFCMPQSSVCPRASVASVCLRPGCPPS